MDQEVFGFSINYSVWMVERNIFLQLAYHVRSDPTWYDTTITWYCIPIIWYDTTISCYCITITWYDTTITWYCITITWYDKTITYPLLEIKGNCKGVHVDVPEFA